MTDYPPMIEDWFASHEKYQALMDKAKELAYLIVAVVPDCQERTAALTLLRRTIMTANTGIARGEDS